jgi:hypothetical protein
MLHNIQDYCVFGLILIIRYSNEHNVSEAGSVSILR